MTNQVVDPGFLGASLPSDAASVGLMLLATLAFLYGCAQGVRVARTVSAHRRRLVLACELARAYSSRVVRLESARGGGRAVSAALVSRPDMISGRIKRSEMRDLVERRVQRPRHFGWEYPFQGR